MLKLHQFVLLWSCCDVLQRPQNECQLNHPHTFVYNNTENLVNCSPVGPYFEIFGAVLQFQFSFRQFLLDSTTVSRLTFFRRQLVRYSCRYISSRLLRQLLDWCGKEDNWQAAAAAQWCGTDFLQHQFAGMIEGWASSGDENFIGWTLTTGFGSGVQVYVIQLSAACNK